MNDIFSPDGVLNRGLNMLVNIIYVGILWIICCIPIVTFGAATTAAYYTMIKTIRREDGYITKNFFHSFKLNFIQSTIFSLILILLGWLSIYNVFYFGSGEGSTFQILFLVVLVIIFYLISFFIYLFPIISRFALKKKDYCKMAVAMVLRNFFNTIGSILIVAAGVITTILLPWTLFLVPGFVFFGLTFTIEPVLKKYMPKITEDHEDADKWYYM